MQKYHYKTTGPMNRDCTEHCNFKEGTMIGSVKCQECEHCINKSTGLLDNWIVCAMIDEAIGN